MKNESEVSSLTEPSANESLERNRHGKIVTMPQRRRENNWEKGKSGNPKGKPKGALQKKTILEGMMKYNMVVSPTLLRRSEAVLEKVLERAETPVRFEDNPEAYPVLMEAKREAEKMVLQHVLAPFIKMQALKQSGLRGESKPVVNINISKAEGLNINKETAIDAGN